MANLSKIKRSIHPQDWEDIRQEGKRRALTANQGTSLGGPEYLRRCIKSAALDHLRWKSRQPFFYSFKEERNSKEEEDMRYKKLDVQKALDYVILDSYMQNITMLYIAGEIYLEDLAKGMGTSMSTAYRWVGKVQIRLKKRLEDYSNE